MKSTVILYRGFSEKTPDPRGEFFLASLRLEPKKMIKLLSLVPVF